MRSTGLVCLLFALACGDIQTTTGSGDGGPGSGDGGSPDARAVGSVTVTVGRLFGDAQPIAGNQVVLVDTSGDVAADTLTDSDGVATADDIEAGSTMIILIAAPPTGAPAGSQALVIVGVEPGDDIHIDPEDREGEPVGMMNVSWPVFDGAQNYVVANGCSTVTTNDTVTAIEYAQGCTPADDATVLIRAIDGADTTLGWLGGTTAFSDGDPFDLTGSTWSAPRDLEVTLSDIPPEALRVRAELRPSRGGLHYQRVDVPFVDLDTDTAVLHVATPRSFADTDLVTLGFQPNQPSFGENTVSLRIEPDTTDLPVGVSGELIPWYGSALFDSEARTLHWARSSGLDPDAQFLLMFWTDKDATAGATFVMVPPGIDQVTLPALPADYERFLPNNPANVGVQVQAGDSTDVEGYRAARQIGFSLVYNPPPVGLEAPSTLRRASGGEDF
jgi:hypothetical protein